MQNKGAIVPGYDADFLIFTDLTQVEIVEVYSAGKIIAQNGKYLDQDGYEVKPGISHQFLKFCDLEFDSSIIFLPLTENTLPLL